jgi:precorrin-2/cobalt-factor-2 C20-methyltransferase
VGVGPGDPELLTLKAIRIIQNASVLAYPVDDQGYSFARETVKAHIRAGQVELPLLFSMSPERMTRLKTRQNAAGQVLEALRNASDVVFITEGDPLRYSTFQHLLSFMPEEILLEICPGVSSMFAAAASAHFPLAIEGQGVTTLSAKFVLGSIGDYRLPGIDAKRAQGRDFF